MAFGQYIPALADGTACADGSPITHLPGYVHNGAECSIVQTGVSEGPEELTNGNFSIPGGAGWSGSNWVFTDVATHTAGGTSSLYQYTLVVGKFYRITFDVIYGTAGSVRGQPGSNTAGATLRTKTGTYSEIVECTGDSLMRFAPSTDFDGAINNCSVKEVTVLYDAFGGATLWGNGTSWDEVSYADLLAEPSGTTNGFYKWQSINGVCHLKECFQYDVTDVLTETEYNKNAQYVGAGGGCGSITPFPG